MYDNKNLPYGAVWGDHPVFGKCVFNYNNGILAHLWENTHANNMISISIFFPGNAEETYMGAFFTEEQAITAVETILSYTY